MFKLHPKIIMKLNIKNSLIIVILLIIIVSIWFIFNKEKSTVLSLNQCTAVIHESKEAEKIEAKYERVISIIEGNGFAKDTGVLYENGNEWKLNRFYSFSAESLNNNKYKITVLSHEKSYDDNVPDVVLKRLRPEQVKVINVTTIENVSPDVWLYSSLAFPIFACKEPKNQR